MDMILQLSKWGTLAIIASVVVVIIGQRARLWLEAYRSREYSRQVKEVWYRNWTGTDVDRIPAWERTVASLEAFDYPLEMILEARLNMFSEIDAQKKSDWPNKNRLQASVKSGERIIKTIEIKNG